MSFGSKVEVKKVVVCRAIQVAWRVRQLGWLVSSDVPGEGL